MTDFELWHGETLAKQAVAALQKNDFDAHFCATREKALPLIESFITSGALVGFGGSITLKELGLRERFSSLGAKLLDHWKEGLSKDEKTDILRKALTADVYLSSVNALTLDGYLCNIDGTGNRVAALTFGPKKTIVVAGINKIVRDLGEAEERLELVASPRNCHKLGRNTPCAQTGVCMDCRSSDRICRVYQTLKRRPGGTDFTVILINENLGF